METNSVICPKCLSNRVNIRNRRVNPKTGKPYLAVRTFLAVVGAILGGFFALCAILFVFKGPDPALPIIYFFLGAIFLFFSVPYLIGRSKSIKAEEAVCQNCRNQWTIGISEQAQKEKTTGGVFCPQCGNGSVYSVAYKADVATLNRFSPILGPLGLPLGILAVVGAVALAISIWIEGDKGVFQWVFGPTVAGISFLVIGVSIGIRLIQYGLAYSRAREKRDHRCAACGHTWAEWADGAPIQPPSQSGPLPPENSGQS